jgi:hypothetical protein
MCDYSLLTLPNRLAIEGERLVSYRFPSYSIGLASPREITAATCRRHEADLHVTWWSRFKKWLLQPAPASQPVSAVCIPPGARLRVSNIPPAIQKTLGIGLVEEVMFTELSACPYEYRDAVRFRNGRQVLLQTLGEGVHFKVLSLDMIEPELQPAGVASHSY